MSQVVKDIGGVFNQVNRGMTDFTGGVRGFLGSATGYERFNPNVYSVNRGAFAPTSEEQQLTQALMARAEGRGAPSPAELQMQAGLQQQASQAQGLAAAQRGISPALAARQAQQAMAQGAQQTAQQAGVLRAQESLGAQQLAQQGLQSQRAGRMGLEQLEVSRGMGSEQLRGQGYEGAAGRAAGTIKGIGQAAALMMADGGVVPDDASNMAHSFAQMVGAQVGQMMAKGIAQRGETLEGSGKSFSKMLGSFGGEGGAGTASPGAGLGQTMMPMMKSGGEVPGQAVVPGDSTLNDNVPALLSPGEIVIPRSLSKKSPEEIAQFVMALRGGL